MVAVLKKSVFGVAHSHFEAERIVDHLAGAGFSRHSISMVLPGHEPDHPRCEFDDLEGDKSFATDERSEDPVLICLRAEAWPEADAARRIFQAMGATNVSLGGENAFRLLAGTFQQPGFHPELNGAVPGIQSRIRSYAKTATRNQGQS